MDMQFAREKSGFRGPIPSLKTEGVAPGFAFLDLPLGCEAATLKRGGDR